MSTQIHILSTPIYIYIHMHQLAVESSLISETNLVLIDMRQLCNSLVIAVLVSEPNPLWPLRDLQYGLGETVFGRCRHLEYMII